MLIDIPKLNFIAHDFNAKISVHFSMKNFVTKIYTVDFHRLEGEFLKQKCKHAVVMSFVWGVNKILRSFIPEVNVNLR
jgi:hypothetical protein